MLGTNGGGFFNANAAHPFENPTPFSNFIQMLLILVIPAGFTYMLGRMTKSPGHGWAVYGAMMFLLVVGTFTSYWAESKGNPLYPATVNQQVVGGNFEGKEVRFGVANSALFAAITTGASCGAVNSMHDSFTPIGGLVPLVNILLGEVIFGGVGAGMYGMLIFVILTVFIAGLMVGRTPEYLGKKDRGFRCADGDALRADFPFDYFEFGGNFVGRAGFRSEFAQQSGSARTFRNSLRIYERHGQQRFGFCRTQREYFVV